MRAIDTCSSGPAAWTKLVLSMVVQGAIGTPKPSRYFSSLKISVKEYTDPVELDRNRYRAESSPLLENQTDISSSPERHDVLGKIPPQTCSHLPTGLPRRLEVSACSTILYMNNKQEEASLID